MKNKTEKKESESKKKEKSRENHKNDVDTDQKYAWKPTALTVVVLMFMSAAISFYGENEGQWFNSFLRNVGEHSYFQMSIMVSTSAIVGTFAFIYWGAVSDNLRSKKGRRVPILTAGLVISGLFVFAFGLRTDLWWLVLIDGVIIGITSNMFHVTSRVMVVDLWEKRDRGKINTYLFVGATIGTAFIWITSLIILPEGTETYSRKTHQAMFLTCMILMFVAAALIWFFIKEPRPEELLAPEPIKKSLLSLFNKEQMSQHKDFMKLFGASLLVIMAGNCYKPYFLILLQDVAFTREQIILTAIVGVATVAGIVYLLMSRLDKVGRKNTTYIALAIAPFGGFVIGFSNGAFLPLLIGLVIIFPFSIALQICVDTWAQDLLPENQRGKFLGIINIGKAAGQTPAILAAGALADSYGVFSVFILTGCLLLAAIPLFKYVPETINSTCPEDQQLELTETPEVDYDSKVAEFVEEKLCDAEEKTNNEGLKK